MLDVLRQMVSKEHHNALQILTNQIARLHCYFCYSIEVACRRKMTRDFKGYGVIIVAEQGCDVDEIQQF